MAILTLSELDHAFGAAELFHHVTAAVEPRDRIALVGPNGAGKTTLLMVIAGLLEPTAGHVERTEGLTLGYLRQEAVLTFAGRDHTVFEEMLTVFGDLRAQEEALQAMEAAMTADYSPELLDRYGRLQAAYEHAGGYLYQNDIKTVLQGLGFGPQEWDMPLLHLSGGQKTRVLLGRLLLEKPALLVLDEPTNHLDMAAIEWLEATLRRWTGALITISHDRYFLDRIATRVWELAPPERLAPAELTVYRGNYTAYAAQWDENRARARRLYVEEKQRLVKEVDFIRKHIAGGQTDIAKGRLRQLTRDLSLIEEVGLTGMAEMRRRNQSWITIGGRARTLTVNEAEARIRALRPPVSAWPRLNVRLDAVERSARVVLRLRRATVGYPERPLFTVDDLRLERGGRAALLGPNGSGKSTLLKTIMAEIPLLEGELTLGEGVRPGYFAQAHDQLNPANRVIDELWQRRDLSETDARRYLAQYLFRGDDVFKRVSELSGGERGRLALCLLALEGANFLLLDEPTNHLDLPAQEALQEVLETFNGTILLVSHDRYLIDRLADQVWLLADETLTAWPLSYRDYLAQLTGEGAAAVVVESEAEPEEPEPADAAAALMPPDAEEAPLPKGWSKQARRRDDRKRQEIERELEDAEYWLVQVSDTIEEARRHGDQRAAAALEAEYQAARDRLDELLDAWAALV